MRLLTSLLVVSLLLTPSFTFADATKKSNNNNKEVKKALKHIENANKKTKQGTSSPASTCEKTPDEWNDNPDCEDFISDIKTCVTDKTRAGQSKQTFLDAVYCIGFHESTCNPDKVNTDKGVTYAGGFQFNEAAWGYCFDKDHFPKQMHGCNQKWPEGAKDTCCAATCTAMHLLWHAAFLQFSAANNPKKCRQWVKDTHIWQKPRPKSK